MTTKILHQIWLGSDVPTKFLENMADWQLNNPDWHYRLWTRPLDDMVNQYFFDNAADYVKPDAIWQFRADLMRYEILYRYGGFYADTDTKPLKPLGNLFDGLELDGLDELDEWAVAEDDTFISNTYLYSKPGSSVFFELIDGIGEHLAGAHNLAATVASGPQYLTGIWDANDAFVDTRTELWFPYSWRDVREGTVGERVISKDAYAIHDWNHQREKKNAAARRSNKLRREAREEAKS